jgi:N-methylhydantoinase A
LRHGAAKEGKPSGTVGIFPMTRRPRSATVAAVSEAVPFRVLRGKGVGRVRKLRVAVDIGGTFTDLVAYDEDTHDLLTVKTPSTPPEFITGVMNALEKAGIRPDEVTTFKHGSTIATNAIIERRGAKTGLVTTKGMRDVLGAGRANRPDLFNSNWDPSPALVQRRNVLTVDERVDYEGEVLTELNEEQVREAARKVKKRGIESVAVASLNSVMAPDHELRTKAILQEELGEDVRVCTSAEILPEIREFERTSTAAANAYLMPVIERYLDRLVQALGDWGYNGDVLVTHSGGGVMSAAAAAQVPARICHSGPAGGVVGGAVVGKSAGTDSVITFDMGGTSADLSLVHEGRPSIASEWRVDWNIPILFPAVDLVAIGAGGGTIAWVDAGGSLRVGPQSAGADPGPACINKGNDQPTITDAHLFLGRLDPATYLGGDMELLPELAEQAIGRLAEQLGLSPEETAAGILRIANASMTAATHLISVQRGWDPREFAFVAGGGAGPLHAVAIAQDLGMPKVIVPPTPGVTSALGILQVDLRHDLLRSVLKQTHQIEPDELATVFDELRAEARAVLEREQASADQKVELSLDVRYYGQTPYMNMIVDEVPKDRAAIDALADQYGDDYEREFGYQLDRNLATIEIVNARVAAIGVSPPTELKRGAPADSAATPRETRSVYFGESGSWLDTPVYRRSAFGPDSRLDGPAIIEQDDTTVLVPPGTSLEVDQYLNIVIDVGAGGRTAVAAGETVAQGA